MQTIARLILGSHSKSYNGRQVSGEIVSSTWLQLPFLLL